MRKPKGIIEVFLQPGELYFGDRYTRLRTLLGSCVSIVLWHRAALLGGMCHYLLPTCSHPNQKPDSRYADVALHQLLQEVRMSGTHARDYRISLFGGGNMLESSSRQHIGRKNIEAGLVLLAAHGLTCHARDVGGEGYRSLIFDVWSGNIALRQPHPQQVASRHDEARST